MLKKLRTYMNNILNVLKKNFLATILINLIFRNTLRMTRSAALQGTDNVANNNTYLGKRNKDFEFADLKPLKVEFVECSARGKEDNSAGNLNALLEWMTRVA